MACFFRRVMSICVGSTNHDVQIVYWRYTGFYLVILIDSSRDKVLDAIGTCSLNLVWTEFLL